RQLHRDAPAVGKDSRDLRGGRHILDADIQRGVDITHTVRAGGAARAAARKRIAENLGEEIGAAEGIAVEAAGPKLEARATRAAARPAESGERVPMSPALETVEARLAGSVDFTAVIGLPLFLVSQDFVGLVDFGKALLRPRIVWPLVRMILLRQTAKGRLYLLGGRAFRHAQHIIWVFHRSPRRGSRNRVNF